jgi:hypothetical protein
LEKILFCRKASKESATPGKEEFLIKFKNRSYLHCEWVDREWIETHDKRAKQRVKYFLDKTIHDFSYSMLSEDRPFNESFCKASLCDGI